MVTDRQTDNSKNIFALLESGDKNTVKVREEGPRRSTWTSPGKAKPRRYYAQPRPPPLAPESVAAAGREGVRSRGRGSARPHATFLSHTFIPLFPGHNIYTISFLFLHPSSHLRLLPLFISPSSSPLPPAFPNWRTASPRQ